MCLVLAMHGLKYILKYKIEIKVVVINSSGTIQAKECECYWFGKPPFTAIYSRNPLIRISLALLVRVSRILQNSLALKLAVVGSSTVQCYGF